MIKDTLLSIIANVKYFFKINLRFLSGFIVAVTPYISMWLVHLCYVERGYFAIGGEVFVPALLLLCAKSFNIAAENIGCGSKMPLPRKRFTSYTDNGAVSIDNANLHEMIVYVGELENWLESVGKL